MAWVKVFKATTESRIVHKETYAILLRHHGIWEED